MRGIVVCNGRIRDYSSCRRFFDNVDLILCADGGAAHLKRFGVIPHILLGDFDSITQEDLESYRELGVEIIKFPAEKDMTDTELALELAIEKGCKEIILLGALGTRLDHSMSNIFLLKKLLAAGVTGIVADEYNEIRLIDRSITLYRKPEVKITLLPLSENVEGVTTEGLYYPLTDATIPIGSTWGVSNEFAENTAKIHIKKGLMLVIQSRD